MYPVPLISDLSAFSGRDEATYTGYANSALLQAAIRFSFLTEVTDPTQIPGFGALTQADMQSLAQQGILSLADSIYLQFPYQQAIASPLNSETIGSYSYQKSMNMGAGGSMSRMAPAALELSLDKTGIPMFDLAVQLIAKRTIASGVYHDAVEVFEEGSRKAALGAQVWTDINGRRWLLGPEDRDVIGFPFDMNGQAFPTDPGI